MSDTMRAYCRSKQITSVQYLNAQTRHGAREDASSKRRIRPDAQAGDGLSWSIDALPAPNYAASFRALKKEKGAGERKGAKLGLHMLVGVSPEWIKETGGLHDPENPRNVQLIEQARKWADTWSNGGCYAARLDLDETGGAVVDLFIAPTAEQKHKNGSSKLTVSVNKALEAISWKRTGRKSMHFAALNTDWAEYAKEHLDARLERGRPKDGTGAEHVEPDQYRKMMQQAEDARNAAEQAQIKANNEKKAAEKAKKDAEQVKAEAAEDRRLAAIDRDAAASELRAAESMADRVRDLAKTAISSIIAGKLYKPDGLKWNWSKDDRPAHDKMDGPWQIIEPAMRLISDWWSGARSKVDALPDPEAFKDDIKPKDLPSDSDPDPTPEDDDTPSM